MTSSDDPFARYDAAYVLGALTPRDRREFEAHLSGCSACAAAVATWPACPACSAASEPTVWPGRARRGAVPEAGPVPDTLLPRLIAASRAERRPRRLRLVIAGGLAAAAVAAGVVLGGVLTPGGEDRQSPANA